jgi:hypothetical protein
VSRALRLALAGLALLAPALAQAAAGTVLFALGRVEIVRGGTTYVAQRGSAVEVGDTLSTGPTGLAQVRMKDGALLALKSGSSLIVEDFALPARMAPVGAPVAPPPPRAAAAAGPGEGGRSVLRLLRGAFRTVTGLIGKSPDDNYRVATPAATIGIRGTDYSVAYCSGNCGGTPDGLYVGVSSGEVAVANDGGQLVLGDNQYAYVRDPATPPNQEMAPPEVLETTLAAEEGEATDDEGEAPAGTEGGATESGTPADGAPGADEGGFDGGTATGSGAGSETGSTQPEGTYELLPGEPGNFAFSIGPFRGAQAFAGASSNGVYTADDGSLVGFLAADPQRLQFYSIGSAQNLDVGFDPASGLRWGRWAEGDAVIGGGAVSLADQSLHWIYALAPSAPVLPASGTMSYSLIGNTRPTDNLGNVGFIDSITTTLSANFTTGDVSSVVKLSVNGDLWFGSGTGSIFSGTPVFAGAYSTVQVNGVGGGTGSFTGFFTDGAAGAGLGYSLSNGSTSVSGAAAFGAQAGAP